MTYSVTLTTSAKRDVQSILRWIEERSRSGAETWYRRWLEVLGLLGKQGDSLGLAPENEDHDETIHQSVFKTRRGLAYRAVFIVRSDTVFVLRVRGPGQDFLRPDEVPLPE